MILWHTELTEKSCPLNGFILGCCWPPCEVIAVKTEAGIRDEKLFKAICPRIMEKAKDILSNVCAAQVLRIVSVWRLAVLVVQVYAF